MYMTSRTLDFWFEFASTYSYPAAMRIGTVAREAGVVVRWRPFLLGPVFRAQGWDTSPFNIYAAKGRYMWRDLERLCQALDLRLVRPDPFPQNTLLAARVALAAAGEPWFEAFCRSVYRAEFGGGQNIADAGVIAGILEELGVAPATYLAAAQTSEVKEQLKLQTEAAQRLGIFGAPSFTTADGELFWGNDRLETAVAWVSRPART
jgi:2-hydroxychromene-2-carboxylate isomerase